MPLTDGEQTIEALFDRHRTGPVKAPRPMDSESLREIARRGAREAERQALAEVLDRVRWNLAEASRILKVSHRTLLQKIAEHPELEGKRKARTLERLRSQVSLLWEEIRKLWRKLFP